MGLFLLLKGSMGDRTTVELTVLTAQSEAAQALFDGEPDETGPSQLLTVFTFYEVNYGELHFLPDLTAAGIAFDSYWGEGSEYGAGQKVCRFTAEGTLDLRELYDDYYNPDLNELMRHINDPVKLKEIIESHHKKVTPLPWDNQEQYGKLYRAAQLITPKIIT